MKPSEEHQQAITNKTDRTGLKYKQREKERQLLRDKSNSFFVNGDDIEDVNTHPININLQDIILVKPTLHSLPKRLYRELKNYIKDLLSIQWIVHSLFMHFPDQW